MSCGEEFAKYGAFIVFAALALWAAFKIGYSICKLNHCGGCDIGGEG